jgi:hypothetical protein
MGMLKLIGCLAVALVIAGCGQNTHDRISGGGRAQHIETHDGQSNAFVGVWSSPSRDTVNDWIAIFTEDGYVAIDGPGLQADGTYEVNGSTATVRFAVRNGRTPTGKLAQTHMRANGSGTAIEFSTGVPAEAPVQLFRTTAELPASGESRVADPIMMAFRESRRAARA